jgi:hypothetical protein
MMAANRFGFIVFALAILAGNVSAARAEEDSANESALELIVPGPAEPARRPWDASLDGTWLPNSNSPDAGGKVGMSELKLKLGRGYRITSRLDLTPEFSYSLLHLDAPGAARLPESLHTVSLGLRGDYRLSPKLSLSVLAAPGLSGDFLRIGGADIRARFGFSGRYNSSEKWTLLAGLIYQQGYRSLPVFPIIGAIYRPDDRWIFSLAAPRPGVTYLAGNGSRLYAGGEMFGGEFQLHEPALGARVIRYRDFRIVGGAQFPLGASFKADFSAGYAFSRRFVFYDILESNRPDIKVNAGPFVKAGLKAEW